MSDVATTLQRLIIASEAVLGFRNPGDQEWLQQLAADVAAWSKKPAPDGRVVHVYTEMLAGAVGTAARALQLHNAEDFAIYFRIVGVILPDVRGDFGKAIEQRRRPIA